MNRRLVSFLAHPATLAFWALVVIALAVITALSHIDAYTAALSFDGLAQEIEQEEEVAVILIAVGVYFEERGLFTGRVFGDSLSALQEHWNEVAERYGAYLLMLGLLMEVNDMIFEPVLIEFGLMQFGLGLMVAFDFLAILLCVLFLIQMVRKPEVHPAA